MTEKGFRIVSEVNKTGWEDSSFPVLCETCLGDNPYIRMLKDNYGKQCKICERPFTVFKWKPGSQARYKTTIVCQVCSKLKNVCQTCLFDLEYGLPVQVRDKFLAEHEKVNLPTSQVNRDYFLNQQAAGGDGTAAALPYGKTSLSHPMLERLKRKQPYYKRNMARICSFFVKGDCNRGDDCPFRHEMPEGGELADQNIKDRFMGENDPVARKIFRIADEKMTLSAPEDRTITTLYVGGLPEHINDSQIKNKLMMYGEILSVKMITKRACAFITFTHREAAEKATGELGSRFELEGHSVRLDWSKGETKAVQGDAGRRVDPASQPAGAPLFAPYYPSMDPRAVGNAPLPESKPEEAEAGVPAGPPGMPPPPAGMMPPMMVPMGLPPGMPIMPGMMGMMPPMGMPPMGVPPMGACPHGGIMPPMGMCPPMDKGDFKGDFKGKGKGDFNGDFKGKPKGKGKGKPQGPAMAGLPPGMAPPREPTRADRRRMREADAA